MRNKEMINYKGLSMALTSSSRTIRHDKPAVKYQEALNELDDLLDYWIKRHKDRATGKPRGK